MKPIKKIVNYIIEQKCSKMFSSLLKVPTQKLNIFKIIRIFKINIISYGTQ